ncbi:A/G-specific adenine glycosylase [Rhodalgimonas zhirmunskyi]|uniref:Adenine DNA glycosylase n=1 Tax=Rhodalgimonas zhirmunskyi TaxID=2964767 RepID=A0AAJ1UE58_9RHOB|nr:A/G-specific adenine glycosylase [Rhodoalgimonas zhirmunskyi]MDQ2094412.1 A/G-specific adenine glycosylase [Rhodoalgimonas zhirmunskyi]
MRERAEELLQWYDAHARDLPWRVPPRAGVQGVRADPYAVWLSEVMLQQTTVAAVKGYFTRFMERWPRVEALAGARDEDVMGEWAGLGYYARARNLLKCARVVAARGGFPDTREGLMELPGIGPYTSAAIAAIAFDRAEVVVDGNVERVMARLYAVLEPLPASKQVLIDHAARLTPQERPGDYAQAVMDLGATVCTPKSPACGICPWMRHCDGRTAGIAPELPRKTPKKPKPVRHGIAYVGRRADGAWLLERRPDKGLLGGMLGWPGAEWGDEAVAAPPVAAVWHDIGAEARHTFTHFHLRLSVMVAELPMGGEVPKQALFLPKTEFQPSDLPTVMRKVFDLARGAFEDSL